MVEVKASTIDTITGNYKGTLMNGERGTLVEATVEKTSASTGVVTITGIEGQLEPTKYYMVFDSNYSTFKLYPSSVTEDTKDIDTLPCTFMGIFKDNGMFGEHTLYNRNKDITYPTNMMFLHKVGLPVVTLTEDAINTDTHMPFNFIDPGVGKTTLSNSKIQFYEHDSGFSSMRISFTAKSSHAGYLYMITLPMDAKVHLTAKSPITNIAASFDDDFGRYVASVIPGNHYGPWNYVDPQTATILRNTYKGSLLNGLSEKSILGRDHYFYNSYAGVLAGNTHYELEIMFNISLNDLFAILYKKPGAIYIGRPEEELLIDDLKPSQNWRKLIAHYKEDSTGKPGLSGDCIKNIQLTDDEASYLVDNFVSKTLKGSDTKLIDEKTMTLIGVKKIVRLTKNGQSMMISLQNPNNKDDRILGLFNAQNQMKIFMEQRDHKVKIHFYFKNKVGVLESNIKTEKALYNEVPLSEHTLPNQSKLLEKYLIELLKEYK